MSPARQVTGIAKFFPPEAWAIVVPVSFITCVAAGMLTRFTTTDPDSRRNNNYHLNDAQTSTQNGAAFKEQVRGLFRERLNNGSRSIFNNTV